jgi:transcriptional antiterminator RfaH
MNYDLLEERPRWYVIYTHPKQEQRAVSNLRAWGVETFSPRVKERRYRYRSAPVFVIKFLFPRYLFARFIASHLQRKINFTRGVKRIITFGQGPLPVDDQIISLIRSRTGEDELVSLGNTCTCGDEVRIIDGPLRNLTGIFECEMKDTDRVMLMLRAVSYQARIVIERELIEKVHQVP